MDNDTKSGLYGSRELTKREMIIVQLLASGYKNREIAEIVGLTKHVVKNYLRVIYDKLGMWNRVEVALWYVKTEMENQTISLGEETGDHNSATESGSTGRAERT